MAEVLEIVEHEQEYGVGNLPGTKAVGHTDDCEELNVSNKLAAISVEDNVQYMALGYIISML